MKTFLGLMAALTLTVGVASANTTYSFNTTASYTGGSGTVDSTHCTASDLCIDFAAGTGLSIQLVYTPNTTTNGTAVGFPGTTDNFGFLQAFCITTATGVTSTSCTSATLSGDLTITLHETVPVVSTGQFIDALSGSIQQNSGGGIADFGTTSFSIGVLSYVMQQPTVPTTGYAITFVNAATETSLQGFVTDSTIPEPATFGLIGAALLGLGFVARKRKV